MERSRSRRKGLYTDVAIRAMEDALHERLIDRFWDEIRTVFEREDVRQAEAVIMRAIADAFAPGRLVGTAGHAGPRPRKKR